MKTASNGVPVGDVCMRVTCCVMRWQVVVAAVLLVIYNHADDFELIIEKASDVAEHKVYIIHGYASNKGQTLSTFYSLAVPATSSPPSSHRT